MEAKISGITQKETVEGTQFGFILEEKEADGTPKIYYPFLQELVSDAAIGKTLNVSYELGSQAESLT